MQASGDGGTVGNGVLVHAAVRLPSFMSPPSSGPWKVPEKWQGLHVVGTSPSGPLAGEAFHLVTPFDGVSFLKG